MSPFFVLFRIRLFEVVRRPGSAFWFFVLPLVLLFLVALVFAHGHPFERRHVAVVGEIGSALDAEGRAGAIAIDPVADEDAALSRLKSRSASAVVVSGRVIVGRRDAIFGRGLAEIVSGRLEIVPLADTGYVTYLVPGILAQSVVVAGLFGMGYAMTRYRHSRFLRKLATTPLARSHFVLAQIAARLVLVAAQLVLLSIAARFAFDVPLTPASLAWVLVIGSVGLVAFMGIGFVVACVVKAEDVVVDIINAVSVPIALLSETFFSNDELPGFLGAISSALPSTQMVRAMRAVLLHGDTGSRVVWTSLAILCAWAIGSFAVAVRAFKWR